jgi:enediyne biosynthesis protein E4
VMALPFEAQLTEMKTAVILDANKDQLPDILLMGNYYENNIEMGRYDAGYGTLLLNKGKGTFSAEGLNGLVVKGQVRHIAPLMIQHKPAYFLALNNDSARIIQFNQ